MNKVLGTRQQVMEKVAGHVRDAVNNVVDGKYNTHSVREAADGLIELRTMFTDRHGNVDMHGNSYPYRQAVAEIMSLAGVQQDERARVMNAVRYHIGNLMREKFTPEELREMGFMESSPLSRAKDERKTRSRVLRTAVSPDEMITDPNEVMAALKSAANLVDNVEFTNFSAVESAMATVLLDHLRKRTSALRSLLK